MFLLAFSILYKLLLLLLVTYILYKLIVATVDSGVYGIVGLFPRWCDFCNKELIWARFVTSFILL